jgi:hypothetical protein
MFKYYEKKIPFLVVFHILTSCTKHADHRFCHLWLYLTAIKSVFLFYFCSEHNNVEFRQDVTPM